MKLELFKRNLKKCGQPITIQNRDIAAPDYDSPDFDETFSNDQVVDAIVRTTRGKTLFDGVGTDNPVTHKISILYLAGVTAESWVLLGARRLDILDVENVAEADKCLILRCRDRGSQEASKA